MTTWEGEQSIALFRVTGEKWCTQPAAEKKQFTLMIIMDFAVKRSWRLNMTLRIRLMKLTLLKPGSIRTGIPARMNIK